MIFQTLLDYFCIFRLKPEAGSVKHGNDHAQATRVNRQKIKMESKKAKVKSERKKC